MSPSHCHRQATAAKTQEEIDAEDGEMGFLPIVQTFSCSVRGGMV